MPSSDIVRLISCNLERDGGPDGSGEPPALWLKATKKLASLKAHGILRQEMTYSPAGSRPLRAAEEILGMPGFVSPNHMGRHPTGLFLRGAPCCRGTGFGRPAPGRLPGNRVSRRWRRGIPRPRS